jgi:hypothetical protein
MTSFSLNLEDPLKFNKNKKKKVDKRCVETALKNSAVLQTTKQQPIRQLAFYNPNYRLAII